MRVNHKRKLFVAHVADSIDILQIYVFLKHGQSVVDLFVFGSVLILSRKLFKNVAVYHGRSSV